MSYMFLVTETMYSAGDSMEGMYIVKADSEDEVKDEWIKRTGADSMGQYETSAGNIIKLGPIIEITKIEHEILSRYVPWKLL